MNRLPSCPLTSSHQNGCTTCQELPWSSIYNSMPSHRSIRTIDLDVTEACNLACIYCFKWQKKAVHMDEQTAKSTIDWLIEASGTAGDLKVNLMGGEPLVRFDLIQKIVPYGKLRARQRGKRIHFGCTSNCTLVTDEIVNFWRRYGMGFHCSIDGIPEVQNFNRPFLGGSGTSDAVERGIRKILAYRPEVMARATISPKSVRVLSESAKYLASLGFRNVTFKVAANCNWTEEDFAELRRQYSLLGEFYIQNLLAGKELNIDELSKAIRTIHSVSPNSKHPCGAGRGVALVDPRGDIWPCHRFGPHQCGGGFRFGKLGETFNDRIRNVFLMYDQISDEKAGCKTCPAALICRSWCHAECVDSSQDFYNPGENFCKSTRTIYEEVLRIHDYLRSNHASLLRRILEQGN